MQDLRSESERLNEVKGHLEIALLEKHFLREYLKKNVSLYSMYEKQNKKLGLPYLYSMCMVFHSYLQVLQYKIVFGMHCILLCNLQNISVSDPNDSVMLFSCIWDMRC